MAAIFPKWLYESNQLNFLISRERERDEMKRAIVIKTIKREDIIGNDDEDFVLIGWQTLINAFTKLLLPTTKWDISTDTILVL